MKPLNNLSQGQIEAWSRDTLIAESQNGTRIYPYFPAMLKASDRRVMELYLILLAYSQARGSEKRI